ncbi:transglycosylase domain-containing protein [Sphingobacterium sp. MYb382]|uniref:transglycosylase domain-containing protein n=1 Tax=Sphingobacterium sp. MYb382 TaxID=2745278 RepID=UPI0030B137B9
MKWIERIPSLGPKQKKIAFIVSGSLLLLVLVAIGVGLAVRGRMLDKAMKKAELTLRDRYQLGFKVSDYRFTGLRTVTFDNIVVVPQDRDTLARLASMSVSVRLWPLLFGDVKIGNLDLKHTRITLVKHDSISNYDFLFKKKEKKEEPVDNERNYAALIDDVLKKVFFKIPSDMAVDDFELSYQDDSVRQRIRLPQAVIDGGDFEASLFLNDHDAQWNFAGRVNPDRQELRVEVSSEQKDVELPLLRRKFGLGVSFDKIMFDLNRVKREGRDSLTLAGSWAFDNLKLSHHRLSEKPIVWPEAEGKGQLNIGKLALEIDPSSTVKVKNFVFQPHVKFIPKPNKVLALSVHTGKFAAQDFFDAIPKGLFEAIDGIEVTENIAYDLDFQVNFDQPDKLLFSSKMDDHDLKVIKWGNANIPLLNSPFVYQAYEDSVLMRQIIVGPENPKYTALTQVAPILRKTLLNTEDPYFYQHKGFEEEAFKLSIVTNIKERKFKRGASTISMQLVKNVFLNRNKTMMRKFEEIVLVWLMESSRAVSKDRMLEIYLNVIEWGKNVYGIDEAANYYFGKKPIDLNIGESLYLSSIVPRPKTGLGSFDYTGHLKPWVQRHFNTYGYIMMKRGQLNDEAVPASYGFYEVLLQPNLRPARPIGVVDTAFAEEEDHQESIIREFERDEAVRKSLMDKLFGSDPKKEKE